MNLQTTLQAFGIKYRPSQIIRTN